MHNQEKSECLILPKNLRTGENRQFEQQAGQTPKSMKYSDSQYWIWT